MKKRLIFATGNEGKMREIRQILGDMDYEILSMKGASMWRSLRIEKRLKITPS